MRAGKDDKTVIKAYIDKDKIVVAAKGPRREGGYTFYRKSALSQKGGQRVRGRNQKLWFPTMEKAQAALAKHAKKRRWPLALPSDINRFLKPRVNRQNNNMGPLFRRNLTTQGGTTNERH